MYQISQDFLENEFEKPLKYFKWFKFIFTILHFWNSHERELNFNIFWTTVPPFFYTFSLFSDSDTIKARMEFDCFLSFLYENARMNNQRKSCGQILTFFFLDMEIKIFAKAPESFMRILCEFEMFLRVIIRKIVASLFNFELLVFILGFHQKIMPATRNTIVNFYFRF